MGNRGEDSPGSLSLWGCSGERQSGDEGDIKAMPLCGDEGMTEGCGNYEGWRVAMATATPVSPPPPNTRGDWGKREGKKYTLYFI